MTGILAKRGNGRGLSLPTFEFFPQFRAMENLMSRMLEDGEEGWFSGALAPSVDLSETTDEIEVKMDLPGLTAEQIDIQVNNDTLTIKGERQEEKEEKDRTFHRIERRSGSFARAIALPSAVDENKVDAQYKDGVLRITMQKTKESKGKKITVKA